MNAATLRYATERTRITLRTGFLTLVIAVAVFALGDEIEGRIAPVLVEQTVEATPYNVESPARLCWRWRFRKARDAVPTEAVWTLVDGAGNRYAVVPTAPNGIPPRIANAPAGFIGNREFCAKPPPGLDITGQRIEIVGAITYRTHWTPWPIRHEFPPAIWSPTGQPVAPSAL